MSPRPLTTAAHNPPIGRPDVGSHTPRALAYYRREQISKGGSRSLWAGAGLDKR